LHTSMHFKGVQSEPGFVGVAEFFQNGIGNEKLGNERIIAVEAGYGGRFFEEHLTVDLEMFYNLYLNPITFHLQILTNNYGVPDLSHSEMKFENWKQSFNLLGGSISLGYRIKNTVGINANYTYRYGWTSAGWHGDDRMRVNPPHLVNLAFHYITKRGVRIGAALQAASSTKIGIPRHGNIFEGMAGVVAPARCFFSGFVAWRMNFSTRWIELGVKANNILNAKFQDSASVMRTDGTLLGAEPIGRRVFVYFRGSI
jgi:outer membrane receptor for ferrienterochelin and colicin